MYLEERRSTPAPIVLRLPEVSSAAARARYHPHVDPFRVLKQNWEPGDTREVEAWRVERQEGLEFDSYRRVYLADGREWTIAGQIAKEDGKKYYLLECIG
ncbi:MAG TPA: hypothetical protein DEH78_18875 [Solibacterales bacterium]|nr:hypothetical protein [Bryobacterales bacterium]